MVYCMIGQSSTEKDGCLVITCNAETVFSEKILLEKFLETISNDYGNEYRIIGQEGTIFTTNLPYDIYQTGISQEADGKRN